jgi:hypothetical protein
MRAADGFLFHPISSLEHRFHYQFLKMGDSSPGSCRERRT